MKRTEKIAICTLIVIVMVDVFIYHFFYAQKISIIQNNGIVIKRNGENSYVMNNGKVPVIITQTDYNRSEVPEWIMMLRPKEKFKCQIYKDSNIWYVQDLFDKNHMFAIKQWQ